MSPKTYSANILINICKMNDVNAGMGKECKTIKSLLFVQKHLSKNEKCKQHFAINSNIC